MSRYSIIIAISFIPVISRVSHPLLTIAQKVSQISQFGQFPKLRDIMPECQPTTTKAARLRASFLAARFSMATSHFATAFSFMSSC